MSRSRGRPAKISAPWGYVTTMRRRDGSIAYRLRGTIEGRTVSVGVYDTIEDALEASEATRQEQANRSAPLTVGGWISQLLDEREVAKQSRSVESMRAIASTYIQGTTLASMVLRTVQPRHVRKWMADLSKRTATRGRNRGEPIAEQTMRNALHFLGGAFKEAIDRGKVDDNPCREVRVVKRPRTDETWTFLSVDEIQRVLTCSTLDTPRASNAGLRAALTVAIFAGLREGELWGLHWHDVLLDVPDPHLVVRYSFSGPTKGGRPRRVPLLPPAVDALLRWKAHQKTVQAQRAKRGVPIPLRGLVWPSDDGGCHAKGYDAGWSKIREHVDLGRHVRFHDLRHTFASHLLSGSWGRAWSIEEVQHLLGHQKRETTERYAHLLPDARARAEREARERWDFWHHSGNGPK